MGVVVMAKAPGPQGKMTDIARDLSLWVDLNVGCCLNPEVPIAPPGSEQGQCILCKHLEAQPGNLAQIAGMLTLIMEQVHRESRGEALPRTCRWRQERD
jgi:hypothetical protein